MTLADPPDASPASRTRTLALAGNPNSGKTTIFNGLTGLRQRVGNYPGCTVEKRVGRLKLPDGEVIDLIDLPGTYSLVSRSPDEAVAAEVIRGECPGVEKPDAVIVVVDASNLQRNLYLVTQFVEMHVPMVVALNMTDVAERRGQAVDAVTLEAELGVPVVPVVGHKKRGLTELKAAVGRATPGHSARIVAEISAIEQQLEQAGADPVQADVEAHYAWIEQTARSMGFQPIRTEEDGLEAHATTLDYAPKPTASEQVDRVLLHKVWGLAIFATIMATLFVSIFYIADPMMGACEELIGYLGGFVTGLLPEGPIQDLWADGIVAGVGGVVVFVPQIAMLFLFLAVLEDSGYLARAAFLMDRVLSRTGLHGKSFIPLLSSFACAIPGVMATRTIENWRDRLTTIFVAPFMSCAARLPVYALLIAAFFAAWPAWAKGGILLGLYALGIVAAAGTAWAFNGRRRHRQAASSFILELPGYKLPGVGAVLRQMLVNTGQFLTKAGTIIFCLSVVLWAMTYYPRLPEAEVAAIEQAVQADADAAHIAAERWAAEQPGGESWTFSEPEPWAEQALAAAQLRHSVAGRFGHFIEPAIAPLGYDWKIGVGLVGAFAAREVFVSTMGIVYAAGDAEEDDTGLREAMLADTYADGTPVFSPLVAVSLLVWFVLAMQCMSTVAVVRRETGGWKWPLLQLAYMNALAYVVCLAIYQVGRLWV